MFRSITRGLSNMFEGAIAIVFLLSVCAYLIGVVILIVGLLGAMGNEDTAPMAVGVGIVGILFYTFLEALFLIMLGASAVMVDIRNELVISNTDA